ncbi:hypothetical protein [Jeotgalibaca caeni]|uniref:hypothetical protein n=1 Tax=Jeotgalibaca caeni TaxID=3028623 RepID=UPI00237E6791|nr:hypothetical protein [Jeotgalibaca caeni]MDE1548390.1 hypothetical protein [Jeotgalibaca caeni]
MIQILMTIFALLLAAVAWFLTTKAASVFVNPSKIDKRTQSSFRTSGMIYFIFSLLTFSSVFLNQTLLYALLLVLISFYTAYLTFWLAKIFKL